MSYTIWDEAHDRFSAVQDEWNTRQLGWVPDTAEERKIDSDLAKQMRLLDREVSFYEAHPEIGGRSARDPDEIKAAKAAFISHLEATIS
ncbi:hypothetical protein [Rhizobium sp. MHM7A]|uniref:hypothetical protein n=1 Tax=Rhizobium sp. MHM7A TaxID=2583233 RepID=UPI00110693E3|nr:hypothetical protein [Rhizobium sp. MHM7A]TLX17189.1 hypothetical protein FFR93_07720 [Rhizobium sp. MHM7A]